MITKIDPFLIMIVAMIILFAAVIGIFFQFSQLDKDAVRCAINPMEYTEQRLFKEKGIEYHCSCGLVSDLSYYNLSKKTSNKILI